MFLAGFARRDLENKSVSLALLDQLLTEAYLEDFICRLFRRRIQTSDPKRVERDRSVAGL